MYTFFFSNFSIQYSFFGMIEINCTFVEREVPI